MCQAFLLSCLLCITSHAQAGDMPWVAVSKDKKGFVLDPSGKPFIPGASTTTMTPMVGSSRTIGTRSGRLSRHTSAR